jgi:mRNA-degrading endonuclease RelE of RelBE toxin-antitoxin system
MRVVVKKEARKYVAGLAAADKQRIADALIKLESEPPEGDIIKLQGKDNGYRLRVRDRRILYTVEETVAVDGSTENCIVVYRIAPRGQAYKE